MIVANSPLDHAPLVSAIRERKRFAQPKEVKVSRKTRTPSTK
jgi:hypothetical protein